MDAAITIIIWTCFFVGSKHTFSYLDQIDKKTLGSIATSLEDSQNNGETTIKNTEQEEKKPSSWASLFKGSSPATNNIPNINGSSEKPNILSIQMEQEKESDNIENNTQKSLSLISMSNDKRALELAGL